MWSSTFLNPGRRVSLARRRFVFDTLRVGSHRYWLVGGVQLTDAPERNQSARADFVAAADHVRSGEHVRHFRAHAPPRRSHGRLKFSDRSTKVTRTLETVDLSVS